jgi:anti-sigma factor RsiW
MTDPYELPCQVFVEMVTDYLEGALPEEDAARVEVHLTVCPPCQHVLDQWRQTIELAGQLEEAHVHGLDSDVRASLMDAFRSLHTSK